MTTTATDSLIIDKDEVTKSLNLLAGKYDAFEIRILSPERKGQRWNPKTITGVFDDVDVAVTALIALNLQRSYGIYVTVNPPHDALLARSYNKFDLNGKLSTTADADIIRRKWMFVDCDPCRPSGISATDKEKSNALDTINEVSAYLSEAGFPKPIVADSGNGYHILYSIDEPREDDNLIHNILDHLSDVFSTDIVDVDTTVSNPARIIKVYGTLAQKGDSVEKNNRIHRMSQIISVPDDIVVVDRETLESVSSRCDSGDTKPQKKKPAKTNKTTPKKNIGGWGVDRMQKFIDTNLSHCNPSAPDSFSDGYKWQLQICPFDSNHANSAAMIVIGADGRMGFKCHHNGCTGRDWVALRSFLDADYIKQKVLKKAQDSKPQICNPGGSQTLTNAGIELGALLATKERYFVRGDSIVAVTKGDHGERMLAQQCASAMRSVFETVAVLGGYKENKKTNEMEFKQSLLSDTNAKGIIHSVGFRDMMPKINILSNCPIFIERNGEIVQIHDYDRSTGILANGDPAEHLELSEAVELLNNITKDYLFATQGDKARFLAAIITPALVFGGLMSGRVPVDLSEANASQTGKGYIKKIIGTIYANTINTITQRQKGTGGIEESFSAAAIKGAIFINLDNMRGNVSSPFLESLLTEDRFMARMPYSPPVEIDPRKIIVMMTSNKADITTDLANRSSCVKILKQPDGFQFSTYPEGDLLDHIKANQPRYLGAVLAVIKHWFDKGKPKTQETRHSFRPWAQTLDWITQNVLDVGELLDGHKETQQRMTNPALNWLRDVAIEVGKQDKFWSKLRAGEIIDIISDTEVEMPGIEKGDDLTVFDTHKKISQAVGRKLAKCFKSATEIEIDGIKIERKVEIDVTNYHETKFYTFTSDGGENVPF